METTRTTQPEPFNEAAFTSVDAKPAAKPPSAVVTVQRSPLKGYSKSMNIYESLYGTGTDSKFRTTLVPQKYVTIERIDGGTVVSVKRFEVGDAVVYDSFNLFYTGTITSITAKCVTVKKDSFGGKTCRMRPETFAWRNWKFDASAIAEKNAAWSD